MGKVIAIMSGKGGVGKTTLTAYIGAALNRRGHRVLITDADFGMRDLDLVIGKENDIFFDAVDIWKDNCNKDSAIIPLTDGFDFLPATQTRRWEDVGRKGYAKLIKNLAQSYDFVIIDSPAGIGRGNEAVFKAADQLLLVAEPMWVSLRAVQRVMQLCHDERQFNYALILNNVGRSEVAVSVEEALATLQVEQLATILPHRTPIMGWAQDGTLHEFCDSEMDIMMVPLLEYIETTEVWPEEELMERWYQLQPAEASVRDSLPLYVTNVDTVAEDVGEAAHSDIVTENELVGSGAKFGAAPTDSVNVDEEEAGDSAVEAKSMVEAAVTENAIPVASAASSAVTSTAEGAKEAVSSAVDTTEAVAEEVADKIEDAAEEVTDKIEDAVEAASDKTETVVAEAADKAETVAEAVADKAEVTVEAATDKATIEAVTDTAETAADKVSEVTEEVIETVSDATETVVDTAQDAAETVAEKVSDVTDNVAEAVTEAKEKEEEPAQPKKMGFFEKLKKQISSLWS